LSNVTKSFKGDDIYTDKEDRDVAILLSVQEEPAVAAKASEECNDMASVGQTMQEESQLRLAPVLQTSSRILQYFHGTPPHGPLSSGDWMDQKSEDILHDLGHQQADTSVPPLEQEVDSVDGEGEHETVEELVEMDDMEKALLPAEERDLSRRCALLTAMVDGQRRIAVQRQHRICELEESLTERDVRHLNVEREQEEMAQAALERTDLALVDLRGHYENELALNSEQSDELVLLKSQVADRSEGGWKEASRLKEDFERSNQRVHALEFHLNEESLRADNLEERVEHVSRLEDEVARLQKAHAAAIDEVNALTTEAKGVREGNEAIFAELQTEVDAHREHNRSLAAAALEQETARGEELMNLMVAHEMTVASLEKKLLVADLQEKGGSRTIEALEQDIGHHQGALRDAELRTEHAWQEVTNLRSVVEEQRERESFLIAECAASNVQLATVEELQLENERVTEELASLQELSSRELYSFEKCKEENNDLKREVLQLVAERDTLIDSVTNLEAHLLMKAEKADEWETADSLDLDLSSLAIKGRSCGCDSEHCRAEELDVKIEFLKQNVDELTVERNELEDRLAEALRQSSMQEHLIISVDKVHTITNTKTNTHTHTRTHAHTHTYTRTHIHVHTYTHTHTHTHTHTQSHTHKDGR
jgi:hypothetical protein